MSRLLNWSVAKPPVSATISRARSIMRGTSSGVTPSGLGSTSSSAPNASIVRSFPCAYASELTMRSG